MQYLYAFCMCNAIQLACDHDYECASAQPKLYRKRNETELTSLFAAIDAFAMNRQSDACQHFDAICCRPMAADTKLKLFHWI